MSSLPVHAPETRRVPRIYVALGVLLFAASLAASLGAGSAVRVDIDGVMRRLEPGTTIAGITESGLLAARPGDVLAVQSGLVVREGGGTPVAVRRNGRGVAADRVLFDGDVVESTDGSDTIEPVLTRDVPISVETKFEGIGPLMTLVAPGSVGARRVRVGAISGEEIPLTSTVVTPATPMIVRRYGSSPGERVVALTFDDGPWPGQTDKVLAVLGQNEVRASFFMIGYLAKRNSGLARRVVDEGHLIGNHTLSHRMLTKLNASAVDDQIERGEVAIAKSTGVSPEWFRPPGGEISSAVWARVNHASLRVALWDVDPQDWRRSTADKIARDVIGSVRPGSIVLLHDGGGDREATIEALPLIIKGLHARGYRFVTLDELPVN